MVAPACPAEAARMAYQDAIIDHAGGEGVWGEMFLAALESAAFVVHDLHELIEIGLSLIPPDCRTALAVKDVLGWHRDGVGWTDCRELLLEKHGHYNPQDSPLPDIIRVPGVAQQEDDLSGQTHRYRLLRSCREKR